jgi:AcrR family transcriptional regulator
MIVQPPARSHATPASPRVERRRARMRAALLRAGSQAFARRGVAAVSVAQLIADADVSRATFYNFFSSKYNLLEALINPIFDYAIHLMQAQAGRPPGTAVKGLVETYWQVWSAHREGMLLIPTLDPHTFAPFADRHGTLNAAMLEILTRAEAADLLRNGSAQYSLRVVGRTAIPLLRVYDGHAAGEALFRDALGSLLLRRD